MNKYNIHLDIRYKIIHIDVLHLHVIYIMYTHSRPYASFFTDEMRSGCVMSA